MPNHVLNIVKMEGICHLPLFSIQDGENCFDFNKIIPMPESLELDHGSLEEIAVESVMRRMSEYRFFGTSYKKMSEEEYARRREFYSYDDISLMKLGLKYITNKVLYGATTWYDWRIEKWDTKWNAYENTQVDDDTIKFRTAWSAPEKILIRLSEIYPERIIEHWWADEDTACNTGHCLYKSGMLIEGGPYENESNEAYENYIFCWGKSKCLFQDENGKWKMRDCDTCELC